MGIAMLALLTVIVGAFVVNGILEMRVSGARGVVDLRSYRTAGVYWPGKPRKLTLPNLRQINELPDGTRQFGGSATFTLDRDRLEGLPFLTTSGLLPGEVLVRSGAPPDYPPASTVIILKYPSGTPAGSPTRFEYLGDQTLTVKTAVQFANELNALIAYHQDHPAPPPAARPWWDEGR